MLSRRAALRGGTAALAVTAVTVTPAIAATDPDAELVELEYQLIAACQEVTAWSEFHKAQCDKLPDWARYGPDQFGNKSGHPDVSDLPEFREFFKLPTLMSTRPTLGEVRSYNRHTEALAVGEERERRRAKGLARVRAWRARHKQHRALQRELGIDDWDSRMEPYDERVDDLEDEISRTPAYSAVGMAIKIRLIAKYEALDREGASDGRPLDWADRMIVSVLRDAERLGGKG